MVKGDIAIQLLALRVQKMARNPVPANHNRNQVSNCVQKLTEPLEEILSSSRKKQSRCSLKLHVIKRCHNPDYSNPRLNLGKVAVTEQHVSRTVLVVKGKDMLVDRALIAVTDAEEVDKYS